MTFMTDLISWRAVFYINIPVGLFALVLAWMFIPPDGAGKLSEPFDFQGALLFLAGLIALLLGLNQGYAWGWRSPTIISLFVFAGLFLAIFIYVEKKRSAPLLDLSLFNNRIFSASVVSAVFNYIAVFSVLLLMPFYLLEGRGLSPSQAGLILSIQPIVMAIIAPLSGSVSDRIGTRIPSVLGMLVLTGGIFLMSRLGQSSSILEIGIALAIVGLGTGTFISPNNSAIMGAAARERQGIAAGTLATARSVGMVLGVGLAGAFFTTIIESTPGPNNLYLAFSISLAAAAGFAAFGAIFSAIKRK